MLETEQEIHVTGLPKMAPNTCSAPCSIFQKKWHLVPIAVVLSVILSSCGTHGPAPSTSPTPRDNTLRTQIFLDAHHFGPGVVDGRSGEFTRKALANYQQATGMEPNIDGIEPLSTYTIAEQDLGALGTMASGPEEQSNQEKMPYTTLAELLSERFHTTQKFLRELNPGMNLNTLRAGASVSVPNVGRPFRYDAYPSTYPAPAASMAGSRRVSVDLQRKTLHVTEDGKTIAAFPITPGSSEHPAPVGEWRVVGSVPWPWYRYDEGVLSRGERTETFYNLPPGPNNPVGVLWAGLNRPGVGIHGTPVPDTIGRVGSHGCIRLSNWDAATFYTLVAKGTTVTIH